MLEDIVKDFDYKLLMEKHLRENIEYLIDRKINFSILCNLALVDFDPKLPKEIYDNFKPLTLFILAGYTFDSLSVDEENLFFEAGFGPENYGSYITMPLYAILQIVIDDSVLSINLTAGTEEFVKKESQKPNMDSEGVKNSMEALLANPENKKFLKKSKH